MFHVEFENNMEIRSYSDICKTDNTLRPYQQKAKKEIFESWDKVNSVMFQMPTGTGKTRLFTSLIYDINNFSIKRKEAIKILIIAHRTELIDQIDESLQKYKVAHGVIAGNKRERKNYRLPVQVASIQTLTNRYNIEDAKKLNVQFVIIDEAHHALASSYKKLWTIYPNAKWLGVTATPWRMNHKSFTDLFDKIIVSMPIKDFIKQGYLSSYKYYSLRDDSSIKKRIDNIETDRFGEYKEDSMEGKMDIRSIRAQLLNSYLTLAKGKKGIIYAININHARHICNEYQEAGFNVVCIDSKTPSQERKNLVEKFKKGEIDIIVNVDVFSEGFDCPDIEFIQLARPTRSLVKYLQQVGRGLRPTKGKENCIILDNVGMYANFGLPDEHRHWNSYFLGKNVVDSPLRSFPKENVGNRSVDTSEGKEEMVLIQDSFESSYITSAKQAILNLPSEMNVYEYPFRKVGECPFADELSELLGDGIILGWTTVKEAFELGGEYIKDEDYVQHIKINNRDYSDVNGDGILKQTSVDSKDKLPKYLDIYFAPSFNKTISKLKNDGTFYQIENCEDLDDLFLGEIIVKDFNHNLNLELHFIGTDGKGKYSNNTLSYIKISRDRIVTNRTNYAPFLPIEGVTIGQTSLRDLKSFGFQTFDETGGIAVNLKRPVTYFKYNDKSKLVEAINFPGAPMPKEWPEANKYGQMTYNKWLDYFEKYGFIVEKNEAISISTYPQIVAVQPEIGLKVTINFEINFKVRSKANKSSSILQWEITLN